MAEKKEQIHNIDIVEQVELKSHVYQDDITKSIMDCFDYKPINDDVVEKINIPKLPSDFEIGLIVGSSGSGKTTILKRLYGDVDVIEWDNDKSIASHFESFDEASKKFGAVGLNSIPTWLKPYNALSNGERFRADMARRLHDNAIIDEFTSVVNREVAISCSVSLSKYIKSNHIKNVVFASCHDDIIPYLQPDWVYNTDNHEFYTGRYLCRPKMCIEVHPCTRQAWDMFKRYHYLSSDINKASVCYIATYNDTPVAFIALLIQPGRDVKHAWREHRVVVLPDYQGMGIGNGFSEYLGQKYREKGCRYFCKTSNPRMGEHRNKSKLWRATSTNGKSRRSYLTKDGEIRKPSKNKNYGMKAELVKIHADRICYSHEYVGDCVEYEYTLKTPRIAKKQAGNLEFIEYSDKHAN